MADPNEFDDMLIRNFTKSLSNYVRLQGKVGDGRGPDLLLILRARPRSPPGINYLFLNSESFSIIYRVRP